MKEDASEYVNKGMKNIIDERGGGWGGKRGRDLESGRTKYWSIYSVEYTYSHSIDRIVQRTFEAAMVKNRGDDSFDNNIQQD